MRPARQRHPHPAGTGQRNRGWQGGAVFRHQKLQHAIGAGNHHHEYEKPAPVVGTGIQKDAERPGENQRRQRNHPGDLSIKMTTAIRWIIVLDHTVAQRNVEGVAEVEQQHQSQQYPHAAEGKHQQERQDTDGDRQQEERAPVPEHPDQLRPVDRKQETEGCRHREQHHLEVGGAQALAGDGDKQRQSRMRYPVERCRGQMQLDGGAVEWSEVSECKHEV